MIKRHYLVAGFLLGILTLLLLLLASRWLDRKGEMRSKIRWTAPAPITAVIDPVSIREPAGVGLDPVQLGETTARPLFASDRRVPPPPPPPAPPPPPDALAGAHLFGVVSGAEGAAIVRSQGKVQTVRLEQSIGEWTLKALEPSSAQFARGEEKRTLIVQYAKLGQARVAAAAAGNRSSLAPAQMAEAIKKETEDRAQRKAELRARMQQSR